MNECRDTRGLCTAVLKVFWYAATPVLEHLDRISIFILLVVLVQVLLLPLWFIRSCMVLFFLQVATPKLSGGVPRLKHVEI